MPAEADHAVVETAKQFLSTFKTSGLILAAVSGGSDSKGLLLALHAAITRGGFCAFSLAACTVDHGLRSGSVDEARAVAAFCAERGIAHVTRSWLGEKPSTGIQAAARQARYGLLSDAATALGALCIATGHTADDQAETIAMRESRSQPDSPGLAGMATGVLINRRVWLLRPFLSTSRADIRAYLVSRGEGWFDDPSNLNSSFERVRVRQKLGASFHLVPDTLGGAGAARRRASEHIADLLRQHVTVFRGLAVRIDPALAENMGDPDCSRAILSLVVVVGGRPHRPGRETAERLAAFLSSGQDGRMTAGRVVFDRRRSNLYLYRETRGLPDMTVLPGQQGIWDGRFIVTNIGAEPIAVHGGADPEALGARPIAAGLPEPILKRAAKSALVCSPESPAGVRFETSIGPYDTFLPCFDLMMANRIAVLFGRDRYLAPPVHDV